MPTRVKVNGATQWLEPHGALCGRIFRICWIEVIAVLRARVGRARRAPWVRKNGNPSMREISVKASGMARGRVPAYVTPDDIFT